MPPATGGVHAHHGLVPRKQQLPHALAMHECAPVGNTRTSSTAPADRLVPAACPASSTESFGAFLALLNMSSISLMLLAFLLAGCAPSLAAGWLMLAFLPAAVEFGLAPAGWPFAAAAATTPVSNLELWFGSFFFLPMLQNADGVIGTRKC